MGRRQRGHSQKDKKRIAGEINANIEAAESKRNLRRASQASNPQEESKSEKDLRRASQISAVNPQEESQDHLEVDFELDSEESDGEDGIPYDDVLKAVKLQARAERLTSDLSVYAVFLALFVAFVLAGSVTGVFFTVNTVNELIVQEEFPLPAQIPKRFRDGANMADWHAWMEGVVVPILWDPLQPKESLFYRNIGGQNYLIGSMRLRVLRVNNQSCTLNPHLFPNETANPFPCFGAFEDATQDKEQYGRDLSKGCYGFNFTESSDENAKGERTTAYRTTYPTGGYQVMLNFSAPYEEIYQTVQDLRKCGYIDNTQTRLVMAEFFTYAPDLDAFVNSKCFYEVSLGGAYIGQTQIRLMKIWRTSDVLPTVLDSAFILFVLYYVKKFIKEWYGYGKMTGRPLAYLGDIWNVVEIANLAVFLLVFGLRIWWLVESLAVQEESLMPYKPEQGYPGELERILILYSFQTYCNAINTILTFLKLLKFVRLNDNLNILTRTFAACQQNIIGVLILFVFVMLGYSVAGQTLYGNVLWDWRDLNTSFSTLMRMLLGDFDYQSMRDENRTLTGLYFWSFVVLALFLLLNFIIAIISEGFAKVSRTSVQMGLDEQIMASLRKTGKRIKTFTCSDFFGMFAFWRSGKPDIISDIYAALVREKRKLIREAKAEFRREREGKAHNHDGASGVMSMRTFKRSNDSQGAVSEAPSRISKTSRISRMSRYGEWNLCLPDLTEVDVREIVTEELVNKLHHSDWDELWANVLLDYQWSQQNAAEIERQEFADAAVEGVLRGLDVYHQVAREMLVRANGLQRYLMEISSSLTGLSNGNNKAPALSSKAMLNEKITSGQLKNPFTSPK